VTGDPARLAPAVRAAVAEVDPRLPVAEIQPLQALVDRAMAPTRFALLLIGVFAAIAAVASWLPARRASRLEPTIALREE
jgi:putative ABC transport system permease protein